MMMDQTATTSKGKKPWYLVFQQSPVKAPPRRNQTRRRPVCRIWQGISIISRRKRRYSIFINCLACSRAGRTIPIQAFRFQAWAAITR